MYYLKMNRRTFLRNFAYSVGAATIGGCINLRSGSSTSKSHPHFRPNIVFIMSDDHATHAIGCYGSKLNKTPNIDRLSKEGMRFTHCFNVNSLCAPSRAALITGKHSRSNGFCRNDDFFDPNQITFPMLLQSSGYETAIIGKWHLVTQPRGFDYYNVLPRHGRYFNPKLKKNDVPWEMGNKGGQVHSGYLTDIITDLSIEWLKNRKSGKPFCLMVHHKAPHAPHEYPKKYADLFKDKLPAPETFDDTYQQKNPGLREGECVFSKLRNIDPQHMEPKSPFKNGTEENKRWSYQTFFRGYLRLVAALDENIGRLLDYLKSSGLDENTVIVYTSDNGFFLGDHGLFNKMWMYEESMRLPLLVRYPKEIRAGSVSSDLVSLLDFAPTFLDFAEVPIPSELQGVSIRPLLKGRVPQNRRKSLFYQFYDQYGVPSHYGIRTRDYKLINFERNNESFWEFYDLKKDPLELKNEYHSPCDKSVIEELKRELIRKIETLPGH